MYISLIFILVINSPIKLFAQITNDDCNNAFVILDPIDYCSNPEEMSNIDASPSGFGPASCFDNTGGDVWFSFTAFATAINIVINGSDGINNLSGPQVALYSGSCSGTINELACASDAGDQGVISILENGLTIGEIYFIRVSGRANNTGIFEICTQNFNPPVEPGQDCITGSILCDKSPFVVQVLSGGGAFPDEGDGTCLEGGNPSTVTEDQSTWMKWTAGTTGPLTFPITPLRPSDDIEFALFNLSDMDGCGSTTAIRCVATSCSGPTGLDLTSTDLTEDFNCESNEDGFVQYIDMIAGEHYGLLVNNFSNTSIGFGIEFGGTGEFAGPEASFTIQPDEGLRCDQDFMITNTSSFSNGSIISYEWNFGERAIPASSTIEGPHNVNYESFGQKFVVLTIVSDKGCRVTEVLPLYAEPCCDDVDMLDINLLEENDPECSYLDNGSILVEAVGTNGEYSYNINDGEYTDSPNFSDLAEGTYEIGVIDIKGCTDSLESTIFSPDPIIVTLSPDTTIELGDGVDVFGDFSPNFMETICWSPTEGIDDTFSLNPYIIPPGTTTYTLTVKDENGCFASDEITIKTEVTRIIHAPNIFSPYTSEGSNDFFNLFGNKSIEAVEKLIVYDRWGNKMYEGTDLEISNRTQGWNGEFNGRQVNPGVYVWYAEVRYLDKVVVPYSGDITLVGL
jgi:gliding motility-associated-like protein